MTAQVHDPMQEPGQRPAIQGARGDAVRQAGQPRWLWPALAAGIVVTGLVIAGVLSLSAVLSIGLFGGMLLMHGGGHGGHGGSGGRSGHEDHGGGTTSNTEHLSHRSHGSQPDQPSSAGRLDGRAMNDPTASETDDHDQHSSHGCH